ncbi:MAG: biopolymer transporter ExbD [Alphaproteobacteria bacterium]|nr:biopolymer transporter ExbD [Alphaproteobacteria bacterium]
MDIQRQPRKALHMNLTSLVDIIFMLVIFFMMTTSFTASESLELSLPSKNATVASGKDVMRLRIMATGHVTINDVYVNAEQLNDELVEVIARDPDARIAILSTPGVSVQQLVSLMDLVYLSGGRNVQVDKAV